jgi:hypothetical protein
LRSFAAPNMMRRTKLRDLRGRGRIRIETVACFEFLPTVQTLAKHLKER